MEKLLIVDDEEIELDGMAELIDWPSYGYEPSTASAVWR